MNVTITIIITMSIVMIIVVNNTNNSNLVTQEYESRRGKVSSCDFGWCGV